MSGKPYRAVLFDFDGTLADSYAAITASVNHVRARHQLPPLTVDEVRPVVGRGPDHLLRATVPGVDPAADLPAYRAHHHTVARELTVLLPGAHDLLRGLHAAGLKLAVCSNKPLPFTTLLLESLGVRPLLDAVLGPEDVPRPKPAPDMLLAAVRRLALAPEEALYIGDMTLDIQAARSAGLAVWVVPTGSDTPAALAAAAPDRLLSDLAEAGRWLIESK